MYQVSYADFVVPLVKAVQEQQARIEALESQLAANASAPVAGPFEYWTPRVLLLLATAWVLSVLTRVLRRARPGTWTPREALVPVRH